jgi:sigma-E factor negative regulatory protein RseC
MITAPVRVISSADGIAQVEPTAQSGCGGCASRSNCGVSGLGRYFSARRKSIGVQCNADVQAGDELHLSMSEGDLIKAGLLAYLLPSVLALLGAGIATSNDLGDAAAVVGAGSGIAVGLLMGRITGWSPRMVAQRKSEYFSKGETP